MTDTPLTDYTEILTELSKKYGCFGITSVDGWNNFVEQWFENGGDAGAMDNVVIVVNSKAGKFVAWSNDVFNE